MGNGQALKGVRVLDLSRRLPGGYCTVILGDMGAEVIKVEDIARGDDARYEPPFFGQNSYYHLTINRGKRSVAVDLKSPAGQAVLKTLVSSADVLVESFRPGVAQRLGADYPAVLRINPRIIYCSISGYGQSGPYTEQSGHDINYMAKAGTLSQFTNEPFRIPGLPLGDIVGALWAANAIVSALYGRGRTDAGQFIDLSITDVLFSMLTIVAGRYFVDGQVSGNSELQGRKPSYTTYPASDGLIAVGAWEQRFWGRFCRMIERPDLVDLLEEETNWNAIRQQVADITRTRSRREWEALNDEYDACVTGVQNVGEALRDDYVSGRRLLGRVQTANNRQFPYVKPPTVGAFTDRPSPSPSALGQDTAAILRELGVSSQDIHHLEQQHVIRAAELSSEEG